MAKTARLEIGNNGILLAKANAWATELATLSPVKDPGPLLIAIRSNSFFFNPDFFKSFSIKFRMTNPCSFSFFEQADSILFSDLKAMEQMGPEVSMAKILLKVFSMVQTV